MQCIERITTHAVMIDQVSYNYRNSLLYHKKGRSAVKEAVCMHCSDLEGTHYVLPFTVKMKVCSAR